jgi:4'-phosphopantetheinyl transferase
MLALEPDCVDLWAMFINPERDPLESSWCRDVVAPEERRRAMAFHFDRDRRNHLLTRALVRIVLSRYASVDPRTWIFSTSEYGKPLIANDSRVGAAISFNISHTNGLILIGVTRAAALGVDTENTNRMPPIEVASQFFAPAEVRALNALPRALRAERFLEIWTLKEAYIKARGMGVSIPLERFAFDLAPAGGIELFIEPAIADRAVRWHFWLLRPSPDHVASVCVERVGHMPKRLVVRQVGYDGTDKIVDCLVLRSSVWQAGDNAALPLAEP